MERLATTPRDNWRKTVESQGFYFHTADDTPYWDESVYYRFQAKEIDLIEKATGELNDLCLAAVECVIKQGRWDEFGISEPFRAWIAQSWEADELTIVGRFDLAYDGQGVPKLLEYNADTPTSLLEAAVIQWYWFQECHRGMDQFNSIHERLIEAWARLKTTAGENPVYFASAGGAEGSIEDYMTVNYLRDTAMQAKLNTRYLAMEQIGWNAARQAFVDPQEQPILHCFKLYPWEWMLAEEFGPHLLKNSVQWLEAPWKILLSNKAILAVLWELFPDSPYLLEASLEPLAGNSVRKPRQSREGANILITRDGQAIAQTPGEYDGPCVWQRLWESRGFGGFHPVIGSWMVNGYACGMGIREDQTLVTGNLSRFVPHVFW